MDPLTRIRSEFDRAFLFDETGEIVTTEHQIEQAKKFMDRWSFVIQLVFGVDDTLVKPRFVDTTSRPINRAEMIRLHGLSYVLKQRFEQLRNHVFLSR